MYWMSSALVCISEEYKVHTEQWLLNDMFSNYDEASVITQLSECGWNSALVLVAGPQELIQRPCGGSEIPGLFPGLTVASLRRKGLSVKPLNAFLVGPQWRKAFPVIALSFCLGSLPGEKSVWLARFLAALKELSRHSQLSSGKSPDPFFSFSFPMESSPSICLSNLPLDNSDSSSIFSLNALSLWKGLFTKNALPALPMPEGQTKTSMLGRSFTDIPTCLFSVTFG